MKNALIREQWARRIERWKESGLPAEELAAELGINVTVCAGTSDLVLRVWRSYAAGDQRCGSNASTSAAG